MYCNRSDIDEVTKRTLITNMERKIDKLTTGDEEKKRLTEHLYRRYNFEGMGIGERRRGEKKMVLYNQHNSR
jgi:hypothetical protein